MTHCDIFTRKNLIKLKTVQNRNFKKKLLQNRRKYILQMPSKAIPRRLAVEQSQKDYMESTGCVISLGTQFQMGVAQKWLKPGP